MEEGSTMPSNTQEFCLRWNNFQSSLLTALDSFKNESDFVDVTLACEGQSLQAHKMLLSACSVLFRDLLKANPCPHPIIILPPEVKFTDLQKMLHFIYQGEVNVHQDSLATFLKTAEMLKIRGLADDNDKPKLLLAQTTTSPRLSTNEKDSSSISPKRPRLSIVNKSATMNEPLPVPTDDNNSHLSGADSDSEMIPVKQELIELKECDFENVECDSFNAFNTSMATSSNSVQSSVPPAPPPPGPLLPSYIPPPQIKTSDDVSSAFNKTTELLGPAFDRFQDGDQIHQGLFNKQWNQSRLYKRKTVSQNLDNTKKQDDLCMDIVIGQTTHSLNRTGTKRWRCRRCSTMGFEKRTKLRCNACEVPLCHNCFQSHHVELEDPSFNSMIDPYVPVL